MTTKSPRKTEPKVSVILTSFNHAKFIGEAIDSVLRQSFTNFELIIWDDASSDGSWEIINDYSDSRIRAFRNDETKRAIVGVNKAISEVANGQYIAMHHSDDVWEPDKLAKQVAFLDAHAGVGAVFSNAQAIDESGAQFPDPDHFYAQVFAQPNRSRFEWLRHFFFRGNALCHPSVLIRKSCYDDCGTYRYGFAQVGDFDMWIRLCFRHEIHVLPEALVRFRVLAGEANTSGNRSETRIRSITENYRLLRNYLKIETWKEMVAIFPEAAHFRRKGGFEPHFVLAMIALGEHPFHFTKLFGIDLLFDLMDSETKAKKIRSLYGFDYRDLIVLTAKHDVFSHEYAAGLASAVAERDGQVDRLQRTVAEREGLLESLKMAAAKGEGDLHHMHEAVAERDGRLAGLARAIAERDGQIHHIHQALAERDRHIDGLSQAVGERDRQLAEQEARVAALLENIAGQVSEVAVLNKSVKEHGRQLAIQQARFAALAENLARRDGEVADLSRTVEERDCQLNHMHKAVAQRNAKVADLQKSIADREAKIREMDASRTQCENQLYGLSLRHSETEDRIETRIARAVMRHPRRFFERRRIDGWRRELADCPLFDASWYLESNPDVAQSGADPLIHYLSYGWKEGRNPGPTFDGHFYRTRYPDVGALNEPVLLHYWRHGRSEGRHTSAIAEAENRKLARWHRWLRRCPLFDASWYLEKNPDVAESKCDPMWHYLHHGWKEGRQPGPEFDEDYYRSRYPDVIGHDEPLLLHYWRYGRFEGRRPNPCLDFEQQQANALVPEVPRDADLSLDMAALASLDGPFVSVIIPTYNRIKLLPGIVASWREVVAHTAFPFEIIFSDDGSSDGSVEYLESVKDIPIRVLRNDHGGPSRARNAAVRVAAGVRLFMIGDDIYPNPDILNVHAGLAQRLGRMVATLGVVEWHGDLHVNHLMHHITEVGNEQFSFNRLPDGALTDFRHFYTCNICIDRSLLLEEGVIFDEQFDRAAFEDIELAYRLALHGLKVYYTSRARGTHYHPYTVEGFCRRQNGCGNMAQVFAKIHPAAEAAVGACAIGRKGRMGKHIPARDDLWKARSDALIVRCNQYEAIVSKLPIDVSYGVRERLSTLYTLLFRVMYEHGVLQRLRGGANDLSIVMESFFDATWEPYWRILDQSKDFVVDLGAAELFDLAEALKADAAEGLLYDDRQRALLAELRLVKPLAFSSPPPSRKDTARFETAIPALIVEPTDAGKTEAIAKFRSLFAGKARIYELAAGGMLAPVGEEGSPGRPARASDVDATVFAWPTSASRMPLPDHLLGAFLAVVENGVDIAVLSHSLAEGTSVTAANLRDHMMFSRRVALGVLQGRVAQAGFSGRILRLLPGRQGPVEKPLESLLGAKVDVRPDGTFSSRSPEAPARTWYLPGYLPERAKSRPVVFVFPIFLAVGGVERNAVEIMRKLNDRFDFVVVSMERLRAEQGSLAGQAIEVAERVVEMPEIAGQADFLRILHGLKASFRPDLVWVCNGSPWFCGHAAEIRSLFRDVPIVDQEAYDFEQGWIDRYGEPGIRSFDYFIAVNRKIESRFLGEFAISPERTRLIYSAIDAARIRKFKQERHDSEKLRAKYGLPTGKRLFTFVARLSEQKRPLAFLDLARRRLSRSDECFVLVGDGELAPRALEFIDRHALTNVVRIPYIENTLELHLISEGILFTSAYEGLPIAMLEALTMGVPVFATDVGDIAEVLSEYQAGSVIPVAASPDQVEEAFGNWMLHRDDYAASLQRVEAALLERFSSESIASEYEDLWQTAMGRYGQQ